LVASPNFFIVGAPKCGTTALYHYLRPHPNVFMPKLKEPHFFAHDLYPYPTIKTPEEYTKLFVEAGEQHLSVGEASVYYLRSSVAIGNIRQFNPAAKIIAMFRNPVDMVYSLHSQLQYWSLEDVSDFETAWRLQGRRKQGLDLPRGISAPSLVQYAEVGAFGSQTRRLLSIFPATQVKLIIYDDLAAYPQKIYQEILDFLGVPDDARSRFPRMNENKKARVTWLRDFYRRPPPVLRQAFRTLKQALGAEGLTAVKDKIVDLNTVQERRPPLPATFRAELAEAFREEIALLSEIVNRDLSHWK
jgi:hypothetical protein